RLAPRDLTAVGGDHVCQRQHPLAAVDRSAVGPAAVERFAGGIDGAVDVLVGSLRDVRDDLSGRGVDDLLHVTARTWCPLSADEHLVTSKRRAHRASLRAE